MRMDKRGRRWMRRNPEKVIPVAVFTLFLIIGLLALMAAKARGL